ncbi:MAG: hypothetical protein NC213_09300, partial [Acetobacter sp.]|nr:hypothetical protein [Bacteroides sp.]MCM1341926.1 hypothetical protein [Acetobacter sp.]MCM1434110.1 hypothetical protein [Clostridiales bacterium]
TYDANGNMLTYGDLQYSWSHGKMLSEITNGGEPFLNVKGIGKGFGGFLSGFKFILDMNSAGTGIYSKSEDIVMSSISLATNIISIFIPFGWGLVVSALGDLVPQIIIMLQNGYIMPV